jgi:flagellar motor switch protein FliG
MSIQTSENDIFNGIEIVRADYDRLIMRNTAQAPVKQRVILRRMPDSHKVYGYDTICITDDASIKRMLKKVTLTDLVISSIGADDETMEAIYRNLSENAGKHLKTILARLASGNVIDLLVDRSRNMISEAFIEMIRE